VQEGLGSGSGFRDLDCTRLGLKQGVDHVTLE